MYNSYHLHEVEQSVVTGEPYFLTRGFTALDIYLTMLTAWHSDRGGLFRRNPRLAALCMAVESRPAYQRVMQDHSQEMIAVSGLSK